jgi:diguanylate cyclase (GGDEF)-like protein
MQSGATTAADEVVLNAGDLDRVMPLHLVLDGQGRIVRAGPTLERLAVASGTRAALRGSGFFTRFDLLLPVGLRSVADLAAHAPIQVKLRLRGGPDVSLRGLAAPVAGGGLIVSLSFGIALVDAVRCFGLTKDDFAPTDLAIEMLYVIEAKTAVLEESRRLTDRLRVAAAAAERQAFTDALTGLANRRALDGVLDDVIANGRDFALMRIDLDFFKDVNDRLGHAAGDRVLEVVAGRLRRTVRASDTVARVGGDEFVVVLRDRTAPSDLDAVADRIIGRLSRPIRLADAACRVSASIGTTVATLYAAPEVDAMLRDADAALYLSKRAGRSRATRVTAEAMASGTFENVLGESPGEWDQGKGRLRPAISHKA